MKDMGIYIMTSTTLELNDILPSHLLGGVPTTKLFMYLCSFVLH